MERAAQGQESVFRMHVEMSCVQTFVPDKLKTVVFRSLRRIFLVLVNGMEGFSPMKQHCKWSICNAISRHAFHCDRALIRTDI